MDGFLSTDSEQTRRIEAHYTTTSSDNDGGSGGLLRTEGTKYNSKYLERCMKATKNNSSNITDSVTGEYGDASTGRGRALSKESEELLARVDARQAARRAKLCLNSSKGGDDDDPNAEWNRRVSVPTPRGLQREKIVSRMSSPRAYQFEDQWDLKLSNMLTPRGLQRENIASNLSSLRALGADDDEPERKTEVLTQRDPQRGKITPSKW